MPLVAFLVVLLLRLSSSLLFKTEPAATGSFIPGTRGCICLRSSGCSRWKQGWPKPEMQGKRRRKRRVRLRREVNVAKRANTKRRKRRRTRGNDRPLEGDGCRGSSERSQGGSEGRWVEGRGSKGRARGCVGREEVFDGNALEGV